MTTSVKRLERTDLRAFDDVSRRLVERMQDAGWVGRMSAKGHAIMRAPDGEHTASVSRDSLRGRSGRNARAVFERWQRLHAPAETPAAPTETEHAETSGGDEMAQIWKCGDCGREFDTASGLTGHRVQQHSEVKWRCPVCGEGFDHPGLITVHRDKVHKDRTYTCPECGRQFATAGGLGGHMGGHRRSAKAEQNGKPDAKVIAVKPFPEPTQEPDPVTAHLLNVPEGDDAEQMIASVRAIVAAPLLSEIARLREQLADVETMRRELDDARAKMALMREAMGL